MPNIKILSLLDHSEVLATIESSNASKIERERQKITQPKPSTCTEEVAV